MINETITYKGIDRQIVTEGGDIQIQSISETIVIVRGWYDLQRECEDYFRKQSDERGRPWSYNRDMVYEFACGELAEYARAHAEEGLVLNHNVN